MNKQSFIAALSLAALTAAVSVTDAKASTESSLSKEGAATLAEKVVVKSAMLEQGSCQSIKGGK